MMVVGNYYPESCGGTEIFTQVLAEGLSKAGYDVSVLCTSDKDCFDVINSIKVYRIRVINLRLFPNSRITFLINKCLHIYNPLNKIKIWPILKKENPDIVHLQMARTISPYIIKLCYKKGIKTVQTLHELFSLWNFNAFINKNFDKLLYTKPPAIVKLYKSLHKRISYKVNAVTAPSEFAINQYLKEGYFKNVMSKVIKNSFDFDLSQVEEIYKHKKEKLYLNEKVRFLSIGRVDHYKGLEILLEEFSKIDNENIELNIAGIGRLEPLVKIYGAKDSRIKYLGLVYGEEKQNLFLQSDVLIFPSTYPETFGLVILEAYIYGLCVIASNIGAVSDLVKHNKTGILVKPSDPKELSEAIIKLSNKQEIYVLLDNCKEILSSYRFDNFISQFQLLYREVMNQS